MTVYALLWFDVISDHMREHTMHVPNAASLDEDFSPVLELCRQISMFLEKTLDLSWTARRLTDKADLCSQAKAFTSRVDEINCQVLIKLNILARSRNHYPAASSMSAESSLSSDPPAASSTRNSWKLEAKHVRGIVFFFLIVVGAAVLHLYDSSRSASPPIYQPKSHYAERAELMKL